MSALTFLLKKKMVNKDHNAMFFVRQDGLFNTSSEFTLGVLLLVVSFENRAFACGAK